MNVYFALAEAFEFVHLEKILDMKERNQIARKIRREVEYLLPKY